MPEKTAVTTPAMPRPHTRRKATSTIRMIRRARLRVSPVLADPMAPRRSIVLGSEPPFLAIALSWSGGIADPSDTVPWLGVVGPPVVVTGGTAAPAAAVVPATAAGPLRSRTRIARSPLVWAESTRSMRSVRFAAVRCPAAYAASMSFLAFLRSPRPARSGSLMSLTPRSYRRRAGQRVSFTTIHELDQCAVPAHGGGIVKGLGPRDTHLYRSNSIIRHRYGNLCKVCETSRTSSAPTASRPSRS